MQGSTIDVPDNIVNSSVPPEATAHAAEHHEEHQDLRVFGLLTFLASESLMFGGFFSAYLLLRGATEVWPPEGTEVELLLPTINTIILVSSSFVIHMGDTAIKKNDVKGMRLWYAVTALMGVIFLGGQAYEYLTLGYGLTANIFANCFYLMTGFHGLHVLIGVCLILGVLWRSRREGHYSNVKHTGIEMAEIYWHFVDIIWIILFTLIYILTLF
ncbi:heme-copper oxidase subunit III [Kamptonema animale CS-326]|jgi:cytochrome c oxidase subunit 3|uniref:cytochrome c oxidase subunit 3 n=1 Tax=Kamptonema animale TaxID=92934 RepID=UPI00232CBC06|nr:heme-copper oxidase subunit III [Kamptonema animale]MDB9515104.1 heme-copper oxidase subunit III [Kamptonema animale CS-326]